MPAICCGMSGVARKQAPDLDARIWAKIFESFTVSEWACVAGICKTTWFLQFHHLIFDNPLNREGLLPDIDLQEVRLFTAVGKATL